MRRGVALPIALSCALARAEGTCPPEAVAEYLLGLFDPTSAKRRAVSVAGLVRCKPPGAEGPLTLASSGVDGLLW